MPSGGGGSWLGRISKKLSLKEPPNLAPCRLVVVVVELLQLLAVLHLQLLKLLQLRKRVRKRMMTWASDSSTKGHPESTEHRASQRLSYWNLYDNYSSKQT